MLVKVSSALYLGLEPRKVDVEVHLAGRGLPGFEIVGLPSKAVAESRERVRTAIVSSGIKFPAKKIMVNLAPADIPKQGSFYDLPIAVGILSGINDAAIPAKSLFFGELSFDGTLRHCRGAFLFALFAKEQGYESIFLPRACANEAAVIKGLGVYPVESLNQMLDHLLGRQMISRAVYRGTKDIGAAAAEFDMAEIAGQEQAKRAMEIAAAGGHNVMMVGSPGAGKTMLARALPGILPPLSERESMEVTKIYSATGNILPGQSMIRWRSFRSPHHSASLVGLVGGGCDLLPGEISLAHRGVLFLDEFNEFPRAVLESLRQPLEDGVISIARAKGRVSYPARFILVASANPCACGYLNHPRKECLCSPHDIRRYQKRISGPILDRIDLHIDVPAVEVNDLARGSQRGSAAETSAVIRTRVRAARKTQQKRFAGLPTQCNAEMKNKEIAEYGVLSKEAEQVLNQAAARLSLSARSYFRLIKIARTIADLAQEKSIAVGHMAEALQYRLKWETHNES